MPTIEATTDYPLPRASHHGLGGQRSKYPWATMAVGESFLMTDVQPASAYSMAWANGRLLGRKFTTRKTNQGIRVWRMA